MIEYTCITAFALLRNNIWEEIFMAYNITDACVKCGACLATCKFGAISKE